MRFGQPNTLPTGGTLPVDDPSIIAFMQEASEQLGIKLPQTPATVYTFGDSPALADKLLSLVIAGQKTATTDWPARPRSWGSGDLHVILDGAARPAALVRSKEAVEKKFLDVDDGFAWEEGGGDRSLRNWREEYSAFWKRGSNGSRWNDDEKVLCEKFEIVLIGPGRGWFGDHGDK